MRNILPKFARDRGEDRPVVAWRVVPPRIGRRSLMAVESFFTSLRDLRQPVSVEIYGEAGVISYVVRSRAGQRLRSIMQASFPQARLDELEPVSLERSEDGDWLRLNPSERAVVVPMVLGREAYLPLRTFTDQQLAQGEIDPLAPVLGLLSNVDRLRSGEPGTRLGVRVLLQAVQDDWALEWQASIQRRRDREDLTPKNTRDNEGPSNASMAMVLGLMGVGMLAFSNWHWWQTGQMLMLAGVDAMSLLGVAGGILGYRKLNRSTSRAYFDEQAVEQKLGTQAFVAEVQLVGISGAASQEMDTDLLEVLMTVYHGFDYPAGNRLVAGKPVMFSVDPAQTGVMMARQGDRPGEELANLKSITGKAVTSSIIGSREVSTLWHLPLGDDDMATMDRSGAIQRMAYLRGLEDGPLVGYTQGADQDDASPRLGAAPALAAGGQVRDREIDYSEACPVSQAPGESSGRE